MKILLREYQDQTYVWWTAKYDGTQFIVNGRTVSEDRIVSIINDNRKNYVKCSSCGKIFPKNGKKFAKHQELSSTIEPCRTCRKLRTIELTSPKKKFVINDDGTYTVKTETVVNLSCSRIWADYPCNSTDAIANCKLRQCGSAKGMEITDIFTEFPGLFDHIITVDKILDYGYTRINWSDMYTTEYVLDEDASLLAHVNSLGIVDRFLVNTYDYCGYVYYSKKYDEFFGLNNANKYELWYPTDLNYEDQDRVKELIRNIYK